MEQVSTEDPAAANQADRALIRTLDQQLTDANQQLRQLHEERAPNAADGQMAVQQSQTNEQLEALRAENEKLQKAIEWVANERDRTQQANLQLQLQSLNDKAELTADSNALRARCLQTEAEVAELKGTSRGHHNHLSCSEAFFPPCTQRDRKWAGNSSLSPTRERNAWTRNAASVHPPSGRARHCSALCWAYCGTSCFYPIPFPKGRIGEEPQSLTKSYLGTPSATAGQVQGLGKAMDTEGEGQAPKASMVTTGASSTTD